MSSASTAQGVLDIADRFHLTDYDVATLVGVSYHTARILRCSQRVPPRRVERFEQFIKLNQRARRIGDLRLVERGAA